MPTLERALRLQARGGEGKGSMSRSRDAVLVLWEQSRPEVLEMLESVEQAAAVAVLEGLAADDPRRTEATTAAHKLIGVASFGFPTVGGYMMMTEALLRNGRRLQGSTAAKLAESTVAVRNELEHGPGTSMREVERRTYPPLTRREVDVAVVEDDLSLMGLLRYALEDAGLVISEFTSGTAAAAALLGDAPPVVPRVILLDIDLPGRSGVSLLRALHASEATHRVRVVMMTARSTAYDKDLASSLGAYDYVSKPLDVFSLLDLVHRAIGTR